LPVNVFVFDTGFFHPVGAVSFITFRCPHRLYSSMLINLMEFSGVTAQ
jgi:hypothetical protein